MKKLILLALILSTSIFAYAQKNKSPEKRAQKRVDKLSEKLDLSADQKQELHTLFVEHSQKGRVNGKQFGKMTVEERQAHIEDRKAERAAFDEKIASVLTEEQLAIYQARQKGDKMKGNGGKRKGKKGNRGKKGNHQGSKKDSAAKLQQKVDKLADKLSLSTAQQAAVKTALEEHQAAFPKNKNFKDMTVEERNAAKTDRKAAKTAFDEKMKTILTAEQYATYQTSEGSKKRKGKKGYGKADKDKLNKGNQTPGNRDAMVQKRVNKLSEELQLNAEQKAKVKTLYAEQQAARIGKGQKKDWTATNRAANKENRQAAKTAHDEKMKAILTPEQYTKYQQINSNRGGKGRKRGDLRKG